MAKGLPIGAWCTKIGQERIYNLYDESVLETSNNGLMQCVVVHEAWNKVKELWVRIAFSIGHSSWENNLLGKLHPLHSETFTNEEEVEWDVGKPCIITLSTP